MDQGLRQPRAELSNPLPQTQGTSPHRFPLNTSPLPSTARTVGWREQGRQQTPRKSTVGQNIYL